MSDRIDELLEVLELARAMAYAPTESTKHSNCTAIRRRAVGVVAQVRGIDATTVSDKFRRQLHPHIFGTAAFDAALAEWLRVANPLLKTALHHHAVSENDRSKVRAFFDGYKERGVETDSVDLPVESS